MRVNRKTLKFLTGLMLANFVSSLAFFIAMNAFEMVPSDRLMRSVVSIALFSADLIITVMMMSCVYGIRGLHEDFGRVWRYLFYRIMLILWALLVSEWGYLPEFEVYGYYTEKAAGILEALSLQMFVLAYDKMVRLFAGLAEEAGEKKTAAEYTKSSIIYLFIGIASTLFSLSMAFVEGSAGGPLLEGTMRTAVFVSRLVLILLQLPIHYAVNDCCGIVWKARLEKAQDARRIR